MRQLQRAAAGIALISSVAIGCGHSTKPPAVRTPPDLAAFLRQPVATPSACAATDRGAASGLRSPWAGHVDFSVFLTTGAPAATVPRIQRLIEHQAIVAKIYYEGPDEAYAEFQRLYTCWSRVPRSQTPASLRVVLVPTATIGQRNDLVARLVRQPGVDTVSCDPSLPCTALVRSASP